MGEEFGLGDEGHTSPGEGTPLDEKLFESVLCIEEHQRWEALLLSRLKEHKPELEKMLATMNGHWTYEDHFYRYYHGSFKVYAAQDTTRRAVELLKQLLPERRLNRAFQQIVREGTGQQFQWEHHQDWDKHTRPILEAFAHARFMVEMAVRYADLPQPPQPLPSGYAALLYFYGLR